ncbi:hypothetical protein BD65_550 [Yersinia ruckeri]|nr:hypothetical protein BD65_550 [Yersinia ruckeri]
MAFCTDYFPLAIAPFLAIFLTATLSAFFSLLFAIILSNHLVICCFNDMKNYQLRLAAVSNRVTLIIIN